MAEPSAAVRRRPVAAQKGDDDDAAARAAAQLAAEQPRERLVKDVRRPPPSGCPSSAATQLTPLGLACDQHPAAQALDITTHAMSFARDAVPLAAVTLAAAGLRFYLISCVVCCSGWEQRWVC